MNLKLCYFGDPILRQKAVPVEAITDEIREICQNMIDTMLHLNGIGLAAPQVGYLLRIFVSNLDFEDENGELHLYDTPRVFINPVLSEPSDTLVLRSEGCLSMPKLYAHVARPEKIHLKAMDLEGNFFEADAEGYQARNWMHENDHLNGILFIDRIKGKARTALDPDLRRIKQHFYLKSK